MMANITIKSEGRRFYLVGDTYAIKDKLRAAGAKWDGDRRAWWTGKRDVAEKFLEAVDAAKSDQSAAQSSEPSADRLSADSTIAGKATYKGRPYLLVWEGDTKRGRAAKLAFTDGSKIFWASAGEYQVTKRYEEREQRGAYGRSTGRFEKMTFGRLQHLREKYAQAKAEGNDDGIRNGQRYECPECGEYVIRGQGSCWETGAAH